jgi:excisionase family DNA binding protein
MSAVLYSVDDVAEKLGLHVRTVRGYVRDGRLPAVRIGKQYRIAPEDLEALTGGRVPADPPSVSGPRVEATVVLQIGDVSPDVATRLTNLVIGAASRRPDAGRTLHAEAVYDEARRCMKVIAIGDHDEAGTLMSLVGSFAQSEL